ncbi:MAG: DEAD/DEAH box helicase [Clostridia bacterium]|nr:DEAD/DEAH box helicase [Clostridia bacterium]
MRFYGATNDIVNEAERRLPFALTPSQKEAVNAIIDTLKSDKPLNTMLAGDVGSGKTVVALLAAYYAVKCGYQAAVMAPTEILAVQHYNNFIKILAPLGIKTVLLCGSALAAQKKAVRSALANGEADIAIGTQALFSKGAVFCRLGLAVIDEQHRFGVAQRTALIDKGHAVDTLTLSATPIPRSLRLTMFGDIDIKYIERRHAANNIVTAVVPKEKREAMLEYIVKECERGARAFLVAPRIEEDGESDLEAAEELFSGLQKKYGKRVVIGLIHGKRKPAEKLEAIRQFSQGTIKILVSTTVVEVGVDVPNASIMAVFGAERFGLATLHQLRGRIGRDGNKAYCFLYTEKNPVEQARLEIMTKEHDGLAVAERDYKLRGAGDFLGESQSGRGFAGIRLPIRLVNLAARLADEIDTDKHRDLLQSYIERYALERVTLS